MIMGRIAQRLCLVAAIGLSGTASGAVRILAEAPVATTTVGLDVATGKYATRVIALGIGVPADRPQDELDAFAFCAGSAASEISTEIRTALGLAQDELGTPKLGIPKVLSTAAQAVVERTGGSPTGGAGAVGAWRLSSALSIVR